MASVSMDYLEAPLNPCSVESIPQPVNLSDNRRVWLVMLACYELQENGKRRGRLNLHTVEVPDMSKSLKTSMNLRFGIATPVIPSVQDSRQTGILDGKWIKAPNHTDDAPAFYFASAHSSGDIAIHSFTIGNAINTDDNHPINVQLVGETAAQTSDNDRAPLCLSLNWDSSSFHDASRIVSTYSNGRVAIHDVLQKDTTNHAQKVHLELFERVSWEAHTMFTCPAEVWSAGFVGEGTDDQHGHTNFVMSGADDGSLKFWDIRSTNRPMQVLKHFDAGVTVVAPHPRQPNLVACGSYDETICLYDVRKLSPSKPLGRSGPLGGGIWRTKWHPYDDYRLLVAAMHGGCRIVQVDKLENDDHVMTATKEFTEHKSMAYGADWLVCDHPTQPGYFEAAASCSFYDKAVYLWDTVA